MIAAALLMGPSPVTLSRGAAIPGRDLPYWAVEEATLDSASPDQNVPADYVLSGGPGKTILIRFGDLERICQGKKVVDARLLLHVSDGVPDLINVSRVKDSWGGSPLTIPGFLAAARAEDAAAFKGSATWKFRLAGMVPWQQPGAQGAADVEPVDGAALEKLPNNEIAIDGLGPAVQNMASHWDDNHGFALQFSQPVTIDSSLSELEQPKLELTLDDASAPSPGLAVLPLELGAGSATATVKNEGNQPSAPFSATWIVQGKAGATISGSSLAPGAVAQFQLATPKTVGEPRLDSMLFRITPSDGAGDPSLWASEAFVGGLPLSVPATGWPSWIRLVRFVNETFFDQSRFSFAREGVVTRINPVLDEKAALGPKADVDSPDAVRSVLAALSVPDLRAAGAPVAYGEGLMGGETRSEANLPPAIDLPTEPMFSPLLISAALRPTGLLGMPQVAFLNGLPTDLPKIALGRLVNHEGYPYDAASLEFSLVTAPDHKVIYRTNVEGGQLFLLPVTLLGADPLHTVLRVKVTEGDGTAIAYFFGRQLAEEKWRGNAAAAIVDLVCDLPSAPILDEDVAANKAISSGPDLSPVGLANLLTPGNTSPVTLPGNAQSWVEIDLGHDRTVGEVEIVATKIWSGFDLRTYETGQDSSEAVAWIHEMDGDWTLANRAQVNADGTRTLIYHPRVSKFRYLRIVSRVDQPDAQIVSIRLLAAQASD